MPDATIAYRLPTAVSTLKVVETYACNGDGTDFVTVATPSISTSYVADTGVDAHQIPVKQLERYFSSTAVDFSFSDDGRLKGVNATSTGTGSEIVKAAVAIATGVRAAGGVPLDGGDGKEKELLCLVIELFGNPETETLSITRTARFDHSGAAGQDVRFEPDAATDSLLLAIKAVLAKEKIDLEPQALFNRLVLAERRLGEARAPRISFAKEPGPTVLLRKVREDRLVVTTEKAGSMRGRSLLSTGEARTLAAFAPLVPDHRPGASYEIPLPKAVLFGENALGLSLSDAGEPTMVKFGAKNGAAGALDALNQLNSYANPSAAQRAAEAQARADLIAQQERLAACLMDRPGCAP